MATPFLRWAGGKTWLAQRLNDLLLLPNYNNYHEPFLGGGAIYFKLTPPNNSYLSDLNQELIDTYIQVRDNVEDVIDALHHFHNTADDYYRIRSEVFNNPIECAARFIYLNQTSYNGIYRVNLRGEYNVPFGHRTKDFINIPQLTQASVCLQNSYLFSGDFDIIRDNIRQNDLIFLDPPYTVSQRENENGFIKYNQHLFSIEDQRRLSNLIDYVKVHNAHYILTNAANMTLRDVFEKDNDFFVRVQRASLIGGTNAHRGQVDEFVFTNIPIREV